MTDNKIIQKILSSEFPSYKAKYKQPFRVLKSVESQIRCRTEEQGVTRYRCAEDGLEKTVYHSCRNRGYTLCNKRKQLEWLDSQKNRLLACDHFHLVFTLPSEYHPLWRYNRKWFIQTQFEVVSETLKDLLLSKNEKQATHKSYLDATPGFMLVLHTWGRQLTLHPHIHCLITAGGLTPSGQWKAVENGFLLPVKVAKALYRGKFQARIKAFIQSESVNIPKDDRRETLMLAHKSLYKKEWSVRIQEKYPHGNGVLSYLSRYLGSSPIKAQQIQSVSHQSVEFGYKDHRDGRHKTLRLTMPEFMKRLLIHQPEIGVHTVRYYGIYGSQAKKAHQTSVELLGTASDQNVASSGSNDLKKVYQVLCDCCGVAMQPTYVRFRRTQIENSIIKGVCPDQEAEKSSTTRSSRLTCTSLPSSSPHSDTVLVT